MTTVPTRFAAAILCFAEQLLIGAMVAPGVRTVASVLWVLGLSGERHFVNCHRVPSRAA